MTNRLVVLVLLATIALSGAPLDQKPKGDGELPEELLAVSKTIGCGPVPGFYDRIGRDPIGPPYFYGFPPSNKKKEETRKDTGGDEHQADARAFRYPPRLQDDGARHYRARRGAPRR